MNHFSYKNGILHAEEVPLPVIAEAVGTPFYCYSTATLTRHYQVYDQALSGLDHLICFAVKANSNQAVLTTLARLGAGADVVSGGELRRALAAGIPPERIVFSGVGKTRAEMARALQAGIHQFNVESEEELEDLAQVAEREGRCAPVAFRINPDVDARTHAKISTGKAENKFGIPLKRAQAAYARAACLPAIRIVGVDMHIGSQLTDLAPFRDAFGRLKSLVAALRADGHPIERIDLGGGLGIPYQVDQPEPPAPADYGALVRELAEPLDCQIIVEPGRLIAGNAGVLVSRLLYVKQGEAKRFAILDAAMNDLIRPAMYEAYHAIEPVAEPDGQPLQTYDFVGPVCETGDTFARDRACPPLKPGALVVFRSAGAYGAVMANSYNSRPLVPEILVHGDAWAVVRPRVDEAALIGMDKLPDWLAH
ncbi:MAG: diaminopimelate decarboxylase [Rhodothalassiaceae bacterium]